ncbi:MAG: amidohydrolase family protein [Paucibacter sp.]|nr:amidohydrolase family protein [Roseateles sp.]
MSTGLCLLNLAGAPGSLRIVGDCIVGIDVAPAPGDRLIDCSGTRALPGLINAHDHLQLNGLPPLRYRDRYHHADEWIADIHPRLNTDPALRAYRAAPLADRLLTGALKNVLSGATTVAHHDPAYAEMFEPDFPVHVPRELGWSHSLGLDGESAVQASHRATPAHRPWVIHAAEGLEAGEEFERLERLGCIGSNTLLVHGVGLTTAQQQRLVRAGAGLIWCPASNLAMFDRSVDPAALIEAGALALGSDSRISGSADLLVEARLASRLANLDGAALEQLLTATAARLLRLPDRGRLAIGMKADVILLPAALPLVRTERASLRAVFREGRLLLADPDLAVQDAGFHGRPATLDGRAKQLDQTLARAAARSSLPEPGLVIA